MAPRDKYSTWVEVDLAAIEGNARTLTKLANAQVMAVLKANAYGHGALECGRAAIRGGANWLGVARSEEALELRAAGLEEPILLLGLAPPEMLEALISNEISITVSDKKHIQHASGIASSLEILARTHLKVDTGMSRLGVSPEDAPELAALINSDNHLSFEGLFTHLAQAKQADLRPTHDQLVIFRRLVSDLMAADRSPQVVHAANSAGTLYAPDSHFDLVRCGIALYGLRPDPARPLPEGFRPALRWKARLAQTRQLPAGTGVSYGHEYVTKESERIGTVPVGYGDGMRIADDNEVLIDGKLTPVVGRVCMDLLMVRLQEDQRAREGDEVVLIGEQDQATIVAEQVADRWGTNNYEVTTAISARVPRVYL